MERFGPTRRGGPVFRWLGEPLAIDLANTVMVASEGDEVDLLEDAENLRRWFALERDRVGDCALTADLIERLRALRDPIRRLLTAAAHHRPPSPDAINQINAASAAAPIAPQLEAGAVTVRVIEMGVAVDSATELLGRLARSAIAILTHPEDGPLRVCTAPSCGMFYLGARRWCCAACGNRARVARHYQRQRTTRQSRIPAAVRKPE